VYQNCNIFNDGAFKDVAERAVRDERLLLLEDGKPMLFGPDHTKGIRLKDERLEVVTIGKDGVTEKDILIHKESQDNPAIAYMLSRMDHPEFPVPLGVFRNVQRPTYDELVTKQIEDVKASKGQGDLDKLISGGETWEVR
jgi:2-oxoglutarate ferredoxin oxidoreductase subunit beta